MRRLLVKAAWAPAAIVIAHASYVGLFGHDPRLDPVMHFLGGVAGAYFATHAILIGRTWFGEPSRAGRALMAVCITASAALCWEFAEFAVGELFKMYSQLTLEETMMDLLLGCLGATIFVAVDLLRPSGSKSR